MSCCLSTEFLFSQTTINSEDFETGWGIWVDGGDDCFRDGTSKLIGAESPMTTGDIDLRSYGSVAVSFDFRAIDMEIGEDFLLRYSSDGGTNWVTVATYVSGTDFSNNIKYSRAVNLNITNYTFTANSKFRIQFDASDNDDDIYIDNVVIVAQLPVPEINITGNDISIANGDSSPDSSDNTNFGSHSLNTAVTKTFTIENIGSADLTISNITGGGIFTITPSPFTTTVVPAGTSTTFTVTGTPASIGTFSATIIVANDDADESFYEFLVEIIGEEVYFDSDGDGVLDNIDIDDDNDGIKDTDEEVACRNSSVSISANYKFLNETFGTGSRTTINATYGEANTTYCYEDGNTSNANNCATNSVYSLDDGEYTVGLSAQIASWAADYWYMGGDHTGDTDGRMALFNASFEPGLFYTASIKGALPNVPITYSFWAINLDRTDAPGIETRLRPNILVEFRDVNDNLLESIETGDIDPTTTGNLAGDWYNFSADLNLNVNEFYVYFYNNETGGLGNDLALDDIVISQNLCDTDSDGVADVFDLDSDNDGIPDIVECGLGAYSNGTAKIPYPASWVDANSDGMLDAVESNVPLDSDGDGVPNQMDLDSDNDGIFDVDESGAGNSGDINFQNGDGDITGDGVGDGLDTDAFRETDIDSDGVLEHFTDGILDIYDYFNGSDFDTSYGNLDQGSPTSSGWYDYVVDSDNDGLPDYIDIYSNDATNSLIDERDILTTLYANLDADDDGVIDVITDTDGDGLLDAFDTNDAAFGSPRDLDQKLELYFDGRNDYADDISSVLSGLSEATLMGWIKIDPAATGDEVLFGQDNFYLQLNTNKTAKVTVGGNTVSTATALVTNQWIHVAATYSSANGKLKLFINGEKIDSLSVSGALADDTSSFTIGRNPDTNSNYYHGYFDEIRVFDKALTADELHKMVYQEIEENAGNVRGSVIPRTITNYVNTTTTPVVLPWSNLKRYFRMDVYKDDIIDDLTTGTIDVGTGAKIYNMKIIDPQTAPLPFVTQLAGSLPVAVDIPANGVKGTDATTYDWSIVDVKHDITYNANQKHLGLIVENPYKFSIQNNTELNVSWYLELDGFIDLEEESQLVQGDDSMLDQDSGGYIERDQQGTANSFNYNYWSSTVGPITPSGIGQRGTGVASTNENFTIGNVLMDGTIASEPNKNGPINFQPEYWAADAGITSPIKISTYWLYTFNGTHDDYDSWNPIDQNTSLLAGEGYTMKGTSGSVAITTNQNYVFKGKPYNGDFTLTIAEGNDRLIGNPYPSALDANEFILDNIKDGGRNLIGNIFNGALYFWDHFGEIDTHILREYVGGYATRNLIGPTTAISNDYRINANEEEGTKIPGQYIPVNQAFFVTAVGPVLPPPAIYGGEIVFKNSQRVFETEAMGSSVFMKGIKPKPASSVGKTNNEARPKIWLLFHSPSGYHRQILAGINENTSNNFDIGYDAPIADLGVEDMFWIIDGGKFVIQGVSNFEVDQELPLGLIINKAGLAQIKIDSLENVAKKVHLFIKDNLEGETYEITKNSFEINLEPGTYSNRFYLAFQPRLKTLEEIALSDGFHVYMDQLNCEIQINKIVDTKIKSIKLINYLGQTIKSWGTNLEERHLFLSINASTGVYLLQINTKNGKVVKKVIVE